MKPYLLIFFCCFLFIRCSQNSSLPLSIIGKWELREQIGGIVADIKYPPGNGQTISLNADGSFISEYPSAISSNNVTRNGTYQLKVANAQNDLILSFTFQNNNQTVIERDSIRFQNNQLLFLPQASCCDIPTIFYEKIN